VPSCQTLVVFKTITNTLLLVVQQCVLNKSQGYWLVIDALVYVFSSCNMMKCETSSIEALNYLLIQGKFESKLQKFKLWMMSQVLKILAHFLAFLGIYIATKTHMLVIILDVLFKNVKIVQDFVGNSIALQVVEYETKMVYLLLL
jgi:hypothetical protein